MNSRILTRDEWPRLAGTLLEHSWPDFDPQTTRVLVVEEHGEIVACVALFQRWHLEGAWVVPASRGRVSVGRALFRAVRELLTTLGLSEVLVMATTKVGLHLCTRIGQSTHLECDHFSVKLNNA